MIWIVYLTLFRSLYGSTFAEWIIFSISRDVKTCWDSQLLVTHQSWNLLRISCEIFRVFSPVKSISAFAMTHLKLNLHHFVWTRPIRNENNQESLNTFKHCFECHVNFCSTNNSRNNSTELLFLTALALKASIKSFIQIVGERS